MKTIGIFIFGFMTTLAIPMLPNAYMYPEIFDAISIGLLIGVAFFAIGLYTDIATQRHNEED